MSVAGRTANAPPAARNFFTAPRKNRLTLNAT